jgi:tRNA (cmo5U34)-methyltransferase
MLKHQFDKVFSGIIGQDYELLNLICPLAAEMSRLVGIEVGKYQPRQRTDRLKVVEIGGGTGITSLSMLQERDDLSIVAIDNEPTMQNQARQNLALWVDEGRLTFCALDALSALQTYETDSVDIIASAYTLHNFQDVYRSDVIREIFRVLKPGGQFINGDRYALDDISAHTGLIQQEVSGYFSVLTKIQRLDLLEHWIVHLFSDESENHVQRESVAVELMQQTGFSAIKLTNRLQVNALVTAVKPA